MIELPSTIESILFCGDIHGNLEYLKYKINTSKLHNTCIFLCGDVGLGFQPKWERTVIDFISKKLTFNNCYIIGVRGNHDDPSFFQDISLVKANGSPRHWLNVPDYSVVKVCGQNVLCVGGGTSIDRLYRKSVGWGYWENEEIVYQPKVPEKIDIIVSHSSPSFCYPQHMNNIVLEFAENDPTLLEDIKKERGILDLVWNDYKDTIHDWFYGHYHSSHVETIDGVKFHLLNIEELREYYP